MEVLITWSVVIQENGPDVLHSLGGIAGALGVATVSGTTLDLVRSRLTT